MPPKKSSDKLKMRQTLRERAEKVLLLEKGELTALPAKEVKPLIYELNVHQMELELQNEELRQAQVELAHARDRYADLYEFAPVGYISMRKDGEIIEANLTAADMLGVKRKYLLGANLSKFVMCTSQDDFYLHRQAAASSEIKQTCEIEMHTANSALLNVRLETVALGDEQDQRHQTVLVDITERKRAEEQLHRLMTTLEQQVEQRTQQLQAEYEFTDTILDNLPAVTIVLDANGQIIRFNKACETISGYDFEELGDTSAWKDHIPVEERETVERAISLVQSGDAPLQYEHHWFHKDGSKHLFNWNNTVLKDATGQVKYTICNGLDITQQREAELQARQHLEEAARLQRILTANEMASVLAHEINQPLGAISMYADSSQMLLAQSPLDQNKLGENLRQIADQALRGGEIIRGLMALVKKGKIEPVALDLNTVLRAACELMQNKAESRNIALHLDLDEALPEIRGVSVYIEQVMFNLLRNAIDAIRDTHSVSGHIGVETSRRENMAQVTVRDSGGGIDEQAFNRLFESFFSTKDYGLGVGLRISHSLIAALGGRLWAEDHRPGGIFHFELPLAP